jgi:hypothetical protein
MVLLIPITKRGIYCALDESGLRTEAEWRLEVADALAEWRRRVITTIIVSTLRGAADASPASVPTLLPS